ncbi:hypothetical protein [Clostridium botulinum]|uniref:hypothetical protein n=1 Tax=Clostridium botulinum TaxID=1491 RepID=UPI001C9B9C85|nr:hypothetical protein [Clostridium botulinum]MBY6838771.1 hypothetical protein [Clostridium botulinum]
MEYKDIEEKYINAKIKSHYWFESALEVKSVLGYDFRTMRGFKNLSLEHQKLAEKLICSFINGHGLEAREGIRPTSIKREEILNGFRVNFKNKPFSYLYDNGSVG